MYGSELLINSWYYFGGFGGSGSGVTIAVGWGEELGPGTKPEFTFVDVADARSDIAPTSAFIEALLGGGGADCGGDELPVEEELPPVISCVFFTVARLDLA